MSTRQKMGTSRRIPRLEELLKDITPEHLAWVKEISAPFGCRQITAADLGAGTADASSSRSVRRSNVRAPSGQNDS